VWIEVEKIKALFLDQREIFRNGFCLMFEDDPRFEMIFSSDSVLNYLEVIDNVKPEVVIIDAGYTGTPIIQEIKQHFKNQVVIAITDDPTDTEFLNVFRVGVKAYLQTEDLTAESLRAAIELALKDSVILTRPFSENLSKYLEPKDIHIYSPRTMSNEEIEQSDRLSTQEKVVIALILSGSSNREIAQFLHISENTVKVHLRNLKVKLGVHKKQKLDSFFQYHRHVRTRMLLEYNEVKTK
jgi:DNA-binding NarL/FixJ family response regulator